MFTLSAAQMFTKSPSQIIFLASILPILQPQCLRMVISTSYLHILIFVWVVALHSNVKCTLKYVKFHQNIDAQIKILLSMSLPLIALAQTLAVWVITLHSNM